MEKFLETSNRISDLIGLLSGVVISYFALQTAEPSTLKLTFLFSFGYWMICRRNRERFYGDYSHTVVTESTYSEPHADLLGGVSIKKVTRVSKSDVYNITSSQKKATYMEAIPFHLHIPTQMALAALYMWLFVKGLSLYLEPLLTSDLGWVMLISWAVAFIASILASMYTLDFVKSVLSSNKYLLVFSVLLNFPAYWLAGFSKGFSVSCILYIIYKIFC